MMPGINSAYTSIPVSQLTPPCTVPTWYPYVCSLRLCPYSCFANMFVYTIFSRFHIYPVCFCSLKMVEKCQNKGIIQQETAESFIHPAKISWKTTEWPSEIQDSAMSKGAEILTITDLILTREESDRQQTKEIQSWRKAIRGRGIK